MFSILLFGNPAISQDGQPVRLNRRKSRALLYYLAAEIQPVHETLLIFGQNQRPAAQQTLRQHGLRQALSGAPQMERWLPYPKMSRWIPASSKLSWLRGQRTSLACTRLWTSIGVNF
jgi:hypothetical protein